MNSYIILFIISLPINLQQSFHLPVCPSQRNHYLKLLTRHHSQSNITQVSLLASSYQEKDYVNTNSKNEIHKSNYNKPLLELTNFRHQHKNYFNPENNAEISEFNIIQPSLSLAESLYRQKDYFNAITEFERYLYFYQDTSKQQEIKYKLALSYFYCNETLKAEKILQDLSSETDTISKRAQQFLAKIYIDSKKYYKAKIELNDLLISKDIQDKTEIYRALGYIALQEKDPKTALGYFGLAQDSWLITKTDQIIKLPKKSVSLAQLLSTFIPGSGEIYSGQFGWGFASLLANSAAIYGIVHSLKNKHYLDATLIFSIFFMRFYNGSRSNARDFVVEYNEKIYQAKINEIEKIFRLQK